MVAVSLTLLMKTQEGAKMTSDRTLTWMPTKDFTVGRRGKKLQYIVMHWGVTNHLSQIDSEVANPNRQMSYHYALSGVTVHQYVKIENTAWHASVFDINCKSIGICINASPTNPFSDRDYETASQLIADIFKEHGRLEIKKHKDFHATQCPGNLDTDRIKRRVDEILNPPKPEPVKLPDTPTYPDPIIEPNNQTPLPKEEPVEVVVPEVTGGQTVPVEEPKVPVVEQVPEKPAETIVEPSEWKERPIWWQEIIKLIIKLIRR